MIKAVFFDIDGTLVSFKTHKVSEGVQDAIRKMRASGTKVIIATGRPLYQVDNLGDLEFDGFLTMNGIINYSGGKACRPLPPIIDSHPLAKETAVEIARVSVENKLPAFIFAEDKKGINTQNEISLAAFEFINMPLPQIVDIEKIARENDIYMYTVFVTLQDEMKYLRGIRGNIDFPRWHPYLVDLIEGGNSKATAMDVFMKYFSISREETMAFGDGGNDIPMLKYAGVGVAMDNASDDVKAAADYITDSVDEDGVVTALKKYNLI